MDNYVYTINQLNLLEIPSNCLWSNISGNLGRQILFTTQWYDDITSFFASINITTL